MKLGILGGTFDPIHNAHLRLAEAVYQTLKLDTVIFVPAGHPPHKQNRSITDAAHRLKMVELATAGYASFEVSRVDLDRPGPHYSVDMVACLRANHNVHSENCYFIIGADSLAELPAWHAPHRLLNLCMLAVVHRPGYRPNLAGLASQLPDLAQKITWVAMSGIPISATNLRRQVAQGKSIKKYVPQPVARYIKKNRLYK